MGLQYRAFAREVPRSFGYAKRHHKSYFSVGRLVEATRSMNWRVSNPPYNIKS